MKTRTIIALLALGSVLICSGCGDKNPDANNPINQKDPPAADANTPTTRMSASEKAAVRTTKAGGTVNGTAVTPGGKKD